MVGRFAVNRNGNSKCAESNDSGVVAMAESCMPSDTSAIGQGQAVAVAFRGGATLEGSVIFENLELLMPAGRWTSLLGHSGVGKTTILRLIAGLDAAVEFKGDIVASDGKPIGPRVAYMAQSDLLFPWASIRNNILAGARLRGEAHDTLRFDALLERTGLTGHADKRPHQLSGGQRQRAALARTLMENRPIILLDEPFASLDARTKAQMQDLASELLNGRTVLQVTHDPAEAARLGHRIYVMRRSGLHREPVSDSIPPRQVDDPECLRVQGQLHRFLLEAG